MAARFKRSHLEQEFTLQQPRSQRARLSFLVSHELKQMEYCLRKRRVLLQRGKGVTQLGVSHVGL